MNYEFEVIPPQRVHSFQPFISQEALIENIREVKQVFFNVYAQTKRSLYVSVHCGDANFGCSIIPRGCEHLKFHCQEGRDVWCGRQFTGYYFKVLQNQKWPEFKYYLSKVLDILKLEIDGTVEAYVQLPYDIRERLEAPGYNYEKFHR